jgi:hypothetical protein
VAGLGGSFIAGSHAGGGGVGVGGAFTNVMP